MTNYIPAHTGFIAGTIIDLLNQEGSRAYIGEPVTVREHMLQSALLAKQAQLDEELILGALLHDIGHLLSEDEAEQMDGYGSEDHEAIGAGFLQASGFSKRIVAIVSHHVNAKRYLCFQSAEYYHSLSEASKRTLDFQGGIMGAEEAAAFEKMPYFKDIITIRRIDELAKVAEGISYPQHLNNFQQSIETHLQSQKFLPKKMVVFDMAGTTINEHNIVYTSLHETLVEAGHEVNMNMVLAIGAGMEKKDAIQAILQSIQVYLPVNALNQLYETFINKLNNAYTTAIITPFDGVEQVFEKLKTNGVFVVLNTGYSSTIANSLIEKLGWKEGVTFDFLITASDVEKARPRPDMILLAMQKAGIDDSKRIVKVGDSEIDVEEGKNADCGLVIGITTGAHTAVQLESSNPDFIINNLTALIDIL